MKIRSGFVSNSSSSSFVIIGYRLENPDTEMQRKVVQALTGKLIEDEDELSDSFYDSEYILSDDCDFYLGEVIADWSDDECLESSEINFSEKVEKAKKIGEKIGLGEPKLICGTRAC